MKRSKEGFSLVEVLLASVILGVGLMVIFTGLTPCLAMITASKRIQEVRMVFDLAKIKYPMTEFEEIEDLVVEEDSELVGDEDYRFETQYTFSRTIDEKVIEDEMFDDGLFVMRTKVSWGEGDDACEEIVELVWSKKGGEYTP